MHDYYDWRDRALYREVPSVCTELDYHQCGAGRRDRDADGLDEPRVLVVGDQQRELGSAER